MVVLRVHANTQDLPGSVGQFRAMLDKGVAVDSICLIIALATGVAAGKTSETEVFLSVAAIACIADTCSYNTILKGLAQKSPMDEALRLFGGIEKQRA